MVALAFRAPFLPLVHAGTSLFRANRRRRRGAKPRGLKLRDSPAAGGWHRPHALTTERGAFCWAPRARVSSRSHRVLGRTMSSRRSPPKGNLGGFCFDVLADERAVGAAVLDEDLVRVQAGRQDARDVDPPDVRFHRGRIVVRHAARLVDVDAETSGVPHHDPTTMETN